MFAVLARQIRVLEKSRFVRNVLVVMGGTAAAQLTAFAVSPLISRLFTPTDFGAFGTFNSVWTILSAAATLEYSQAILLPRERGEALRLFAISLVSTCAVACAALALGIVFQAPLNSLMATTGLSGLGFLFLGTIACGLNSSFQAWCVREKKFKRTSVSQVVRSLSTSTFQIGTGIGNLGATGLVASSVAGEALATVALGQAAVRDIQLHRVPLSWSDLKKTAHEYLDFPLFSASQNVINALSSGLPVLFLTHYYGLAVAGSYAFATRVLNVPLAFVLRPLRQVLFQRAAEMSHEGNSLLGLFKRSTVALLGIGLVPASLVVVAGDSLFPWVFGEEWVQAGEFAESLMIWLLFAFCNLPAVLFASNLGFQRRRGKVNRRF